MGINGVFGTGIPSVYPSSPEKVPEVLNNLEATLSWLEHNLKGPAINALEGWGFPNEPCDSARILHWMRAFTTLSLTFSDGYVLFNNGKDLGHNHCWYEFWDADLGRPVGREIATVSRDRRALHQGVHERLGGIQSQRRVPQIITLPEEAQGVASGSGGGGACTLPNLDGEMYLAYACS